MHQQINLYQPIFSERSSSFSAIPVAGGLLLVLFGLSAFTWMEHRQVRQLETEVAGLRAQQAERQATPETEDQINGQETAEELEERVKRLEARVTERAHAVQMLQSGAAGRATGFAQRMEALARRHVDGLWLDQIILSGTKDAMSLSGTALGPDVVSQYLRSLASEPALSGTRFDDFLIERPSKVTAPAAKTDESSPSGSPAFADTIRFRAASKSLQKSSEAAS